MHKCPHPDCNQMVPDEMLACRPHWFKVPKLLRQEIWSTYRRAPGSPEYLAAVMAAIDSMRSEGA